jgi:hypothetical protein
MQEGDRMTVTMDLGVSEAYRHEAEVEFEEWVSPSDGGRAERITVKCDCGKVFDGVFPEGTHESMEDGDVFADKMVMEPWQRHVWAEIREAGQFEEARANSVEFVDADDVARLVISPAVPVGHEREAAARSMAWMYLENIERRVRDAKEALNTPAGDFGEATRIPTMRTWAQQIAEQARWLKEDMDRIEHGSGPQGAKEEGK